MRLDENGLTVYPLKIEKVCRKWKLGDGVSERGRVGETWLLRAVRGSGARFEPEQPIEVGLIEPAFTLRSNAGDRAGPT
jgi:hypothetical protein